MARDGGGTGPRRARPGGARALCYAPAMIAGRVHRLAVEHAALRGNPWGDPVAREVPVYLPPDAAPGEDLPWIGVLAGFTGTGSGQLAGTPWSPGLAARYERLLEQGRVARAALVFPDGFTRLGGSQYLNSEANGRYEDALLEDVIPRVEQELGIGGRRERRGWVGKSSGGFGALSLCLRHPDRFFALASHAGDAAFELCYRPDFPKLASMLETHGGVEGFVEAFEAAPRKTGALITAMNVLAMAAAYSPDPDEPLGIALPFDPRTCALREDVWARWLAHDPVEVARERGHVLADFGCVFVDAGLRDEYALQYGARRLVDALSAHGVEVHHEEFDDGHMGVSYRYEASLPWLTEALSA